MRHAPEKLCAEGVRKREHLRERHREECSLVGEKFNQREKGEKEM